MKRFIAFAMVLAASLAAGYLLGNHNKSEAKQPAADHPAQLDWSRKIVVLNPSKQTRTEYEPISVKLVDDDGKTTSIRFREQPGDYQKISVISIGDGVVIYAESP